MKKVWLLLLAVLILNGLTAYATSIPSQHDEQGDVLVEKVIASLALLESEIDDYELNKKTLFEDNTYINDIKRNIEVYNNNDIDSSEKDIAYKSLCNLVDPDEESYIAYTLEIEAAYVESLLSTKILSRFHGLGFALDENERKEYGKTVLDYIKQDMQADFDNRIDNQIGTLIERIDQLSINREDNKKINDSSLIEQKYTLSNRNNFLVFIVIALVIFIILILYSLLVKKLNNNSKNIELITSDIDSLCKKIAISEEQIVQMQNLLKQSSEREVIKREDSPKRLNANRNNEFPFNTETRNNYRTLLQDVNARCNNNALNHIIDDMLKRNYSMFHLACNQNLGTNTNTNPDNVLFTRVSNSYYLAGYKDGGRVYVFPIAKKIRYIDYISNGLHVLFDVEISNSMQNIIIDKVLKPAELVLTYGETEAVKYKVREPGKLQLID